MSEAQSILVESFPEALSSLNEDPGRVITGLEVEKPLGPNAAIIGNGHGGERELLDTSVPVESEVGGEGRQPVDLALERSGNRFVPANPIAELELPAAAEGAIQLHEGVKVRLPTSNDHEAVPLGEENLFFLETERSTDTLLSPVAGGVEISEQLRSRESPDRFSFELELPEGATLQAAHDGGAEILSEDGTVVEEVPPPSALDAQGAAVPVEMQVAGESLVVEVADEGESSFAYPILVDPEFVEETTNFGAWIQSPGGGFGLRNLGSSLNAYSQWNQTYAANTHAQWVYPAPGETGSIEAATFKPIDFLVGSCHTAQPHGYIGLYNVATGSYDSLYVYSGANLENWEFQTGWVGGPSTRDAMIGIGTGNQAVNIGCYHEIYVGGYSIQLGDSAQPSLSTASSDQWMDGSPIRLNVSASDSGLGVKRFRTEAVDTSGNPTWETINSCIGTHASPCPNVWNLAEGSQPMLSFNPAMMREGIDQLKITAYDPVDEPSTTSNTITVRVDHAPPTLAVSGTVTEQATLGTEGPSYTIKAVAEDGVPGSEDPAQARAGVKNLRFFEDGTEIEPGRAQPECVGTQSCKATREYKIPTLSRSAGVHHILVTSEDALGHLASKEISYSITHDATPPKLTTTGMPTESTVVGAHPPRYSALATDAGRGVTSLIFKVDGKVVEELTQSCPDGGCSLEGSAAPDFSEASAGRHVLAVVATDAGGNSETIWRDLVLNPAPPNLALTGLVAERDGEPLGADEGNLHILALAPGSSTSANGPVPTQPTFISAFGATGSSSGQLDGPRGIAADGEGHVWVVDRANSRVEEFNESGEYLGQFGSWGSGNGQFEGPWGIAVTPSGNLWVADAGNQRLQEFNSKGEFIQKFGTAATGASKGTEFIRPEGIALAPGGMIWVSDNSGARIAEFRETVSSESERFVRDVATTGTGNPGLAAPLGLAVDASGNLWAADDGDNQVIEYSSEGSFLRALGSSGSANGQFEEITDVAMGPSGDLYVIDQGNDRVQVFNPSGEFLTKFDTAGNGNGNFTEPRAIAFGAGNTIFITDKGNNRVHKWSLTPGPSDGDKIASIDLELDEEEVPGYPQLCEGTCRQLDSDYTYHSISPEPHTLNIEATDTFGNTISRTIEVDVPAEAEGTPACSSEVSEEPSTETVSVGEAISTMEEALPTAIAPSEPGVNETGEAEVNPTYSKPDPNLVAEGTMARSETSIDPSGGVSLSRIGCLSLGSTTGAATGATVVNSDAAIFANTGAEADTAVRPTADGVIMVQSIRGPESMSDFTWNVKLHGGEELVELDSGAIAIIEPDSGNHETEGSGELAEEPAPESLGDPEAIANAESQRENGEYEIAQATNETSGTVVAVIAEPWILLANDEIIPAHITIAPVIYEPNEYIVHVHMPPNEWEAEVFPVQVVATASISTASGSCLHIHSPCGGPDLDAAAQYAVYWGNQSHLGARNPFYMNFGSNNCTNFISQILRAGGEKQMRFGHKDNDAWWYHRQLPWSPSFSFYYEAADFSPTWTLADVLPRFLWQYGYVHIDPVNEPYGWTKGDIIAENWFADGYGEFNHLQFVVGTTGSGSGREPLIANESSEGSNYSALRWSKVRERIQAAEPAGWERVPLAWKHTMANADEKKHDPANLYGPNGVFNG